MSSLNDWMDGLRDMAEKDRQAEEEFSKQLRDPDHTIVDENGVEYGFWRVEGGILSLRRSPKGHWLMWMDRREYDNELLDILQPLIDLKGISAKREDVK